MLFHISLNIGMLIQHKDPIRKNPNHSLFSSITHKINISAVQETIVTYEYATIFVLDSVPAKNYKNYP